MRGSSRRGRTAAIAEVLTLSTSVAQGTEADKRYAAFQLSARLVPATFRARQPQLSCFSPFASFFARQTRAEPLVQWASLLAAIVVSLQLLELKVHLTFFLISCLSLEE